jgi:hypothetical protein
VSNRRRSIWSTNNCLRTRFLRGTSMLTLLHHLRGLGVIGKGIRLVKVNKPALPICQTTPRLLLLLQGVHSRLWAMAVPRTYPARGCSLFNTQRPQFSQIGSAGSVQPRAPRTLPSATQAGASQAKFCKYQMPILGTTAPREIPRRCKELPLHRNRGRGESPTL